MTKQLSLTQVRRPSLCGKLQYYLSIFEWTKCCLCLQISPLYRSVGCNFASLQKSPFLYVNRSPAIRFSCLRKKLYGTEWTKPWFKRRNSKRTECFRAITRGAYSITEGPIVDVLQLYQSYIWTLIQTRRKGMACHRDTSVHRLQRFAIFLSLRFQRCIRCGNDFLVLKTGKNPHDVVFHEWFHFLVCSAEEDLSINLFPAVRHLKAFDSFFPLMTVMTEIFVNASLDWRISWLIMTRHVIISSPIHILTVFVVDWFLYSPNVSAIKYVVIISTREVNSWSLMRIWHQLGVS